MMMMKSSSLVPTLLIPKLGGRGTYVINEPGLYSLLLRSRKPEARAYCNGVALSDGSPMRKRQRLPVLPTIRKTGGTYMDNQLIMGHIGLSPS